MTVSAFPPGSLCRSSWYLCRLQFILFIIPFTEKLIICRRQIIISSKNFSLRTNGAYRTFHTSIDNWFPLVTAFTASPPDIFPRLCIYFIRLQWQVLLRPLRSNFRVCCLQIVKSFQEYVPTAIRAACPIYRSALNGSFPLVSFLSSPNHFLMRTNRNFCRFYLILFRPLLFQ